MHWWSRIGLPVIRSRTGATPMKRRLPFSFGDYPENLILVPLLLLLNHLVAVFEIAFAIGVNSLALFSHGAHTVFNGIILTGVVTSLFINWRSSGRYSLTYVGTVAKTNFLVGLGMLMNAVVVAYLSARDVLEPAEIARGELYFLAPVPALLLDLLGSYLVLRGNDSAVSGAKGASLEAERERRRKMSARSVHWHMLANAVGSVGAIGATILVQRFEWTAADGVCSGFVALTMFVCALLILEESVAMIIAVRTRPSVFVVGYRVNEEVDDSTDNFNA